MSGTSVAAWTMGSRRWLALILLCAVQFMVVLVLSSVSIALPSVEEDLGFSEKCLQWVVSGYALTFGGFCCSRGAVALFDRRRDECEEAASKREDSQENYAYLALRADRRPGSEDNGRRKSAHGSETRRCRASSTGRR